MKTLQHITILAISTLFLGCGSGGSGGDITLSPESIETTIIINEVLASNKTILKDLDYNNYSDWIELYNRSNSNINLENYGLSDSNKGASWKFPLGTIIKANDYLLIWADDKNSTTSLHTDFKLSKNGDKVVLYDVSGVEIDRVEFKSQYSDVSYAYNGDGDFIKTVIPTPKNINTILEALKSSKPNISLSGGAYITQQKVLLSAEDGARIYYTLNGDDVTTASEYYGKQGDLNTTAIFINEYAELKAASVEKEQGKMLSNEERSIYTFSTTILINEILADNNGTNSDENGEYGDWIELYNSSISTVNLNGYALSDSKKGATWNFPTDTVMPTHSYLLVWADDKNSTTSLHTDFKLSAKNDKVVLYDNSGIIIDLVEFKDQKQNYSYAKDFNNTFKESYIVTPLQENIIGEVTQSKKPIFNPDGGVFSSTINISLEHNNALIYYTTDGKNATKESALYRYSIPVSSFTEINSVAQEPEAGKLLSSNKDEFYAINNGIYIDEVLAKNDTINSDPDFNEYGDWIEIYNATNESINIGEYGLSTNKKSVSWYFPENTVLESHTYLLVWADNKNISKSAHHTNFKLSAKSDEVVLYNSSGVIVDFFKFKNQVVDKSIKRITSTQPWSSYSTSPSPQY